ncbi:MAG: efflux RND transporter periplasmic adaptor subunit [Methylophilaceae bacterium]
MVKNANSIQNIFIACLLALAVAACGKKQDEGQAGAQMPPMPVTVIAAEPTSVPISTEVVGQTEGAKEVEVRPRVGGIVLKKLFEEGAAIKTGQPMFLIDQQPYKIALSNAQGELMHRTARLEQTSREAARLKDLLATQSISQREYDNAVSDNVMATADIMQTQAAINEAKLNLSYTTIIAPASGMAGRFLFSEGALVEPNTSLLTTISDLSPIWVRFSLSESELAALGGKLNGNTVKKNLPNIIKRPRI